MLSARVAAVDTRLGQASNLGTQGPMLDKADRPGMAGSCICREAVSGIKCPKGSVMHKE